MGKVYGLHALQLNPGVTGEDFERFAASNIKQWPGLPGRASCYSMATVAMRSGSMSPSWSWTHRSARPGLANRPDGGHRRRAPVGRRGWTTDGGVATVCQPTARGGGCALYGLPRDRRVGGRSTSPSNGAWSTPETLNDNEHAGMKKPNGAQAPAERAVGPAPPPRPLGVYAATAFHVLSVSVQPSPARVSEEHLTRSAKEEVTGPVEYGAGAPWVDVQEGDVVAEGFLATAADQDWAVERLGDLRQVGEAWAAPIRARKS